MNRGRTLVEPGEIGLVATEETGDSLHQHRVGGSGVETAGFFERQDPLDPAVALGARRPQGPLPPQDATAQRPVTVDGGIAPSTSASKPCRATFAAHGSSVMHPLL